MKQINRTDLDQILKGNGIKARLAKELRFPVLASDQWKNIELLAVYTKDSNKGVLVLSPGNYITALPFSINRRVADQRTGRLKPIICDFCFTYQKGSNAAVITFAKGAQSSMSHLCCADLLCSSHVRDLTPVSTYSRTQLHEDLDAPQRVERLQQRLKQFIERFEAL